MSDRRAAPGRRWTIAVVVCMLVLAANVGAQAASKGVRRPAKPAAAKATTPQPSTLNGVYTDEQAERGRQFYLGMCKSCHTPESHTGATFNKYWRGKKLSDLFMFIRTQMPKNDPGSLDPYDVADVTAYLLKINAQPTGTGELYPDADSLSKFRIEVKTRPTTAKRKKP